MVTQKMIGKTKKSSMILVSLVSVLIMASMADAAIVSPIHIIMTDIDSWGLTLPDGMSNTLDGSGGWWALTGTAMNPTTGGSLTPAAPEASVIMGDAGDTGLFDYDIGVYGYFGGIDQIWHATPGVFVDGFTNVVALYLMDDNFTTATFVEHPVLTPKIVDAEAGGPYEIEPGGTVILDGSDSFCGYQNAPIYDVFHL